MDASLNSPDALAAQRLRRERHRVRQSCATAAVFFYVWLVFQGNWREPLVIASGTALYVLCIWPMLSWIEKRPYNFPTLEVFFLSFLPTYTMPFLTGHSILASYEPSVVFAAARHTFLFLAAAGLAYHLTSGRPGRAYWWRQQIITGDNIRLLLVVAAGNVGYLVVSTFFWRPPLGLSGPLRAASTGMLIIAAFSLGRFWAEELLTKSQRALLTTLLVVAFITHVSSLYLVTAASLCSVCLLGHASAGRRMPWLGVAIIAVVLGVLHSGKSEMRERYWKIDTGRQVQFGRLPDFFSDWFAASVTSSLGDESDDTKLSATRGLLERGSLVHMLCLVVNSSPEPRPFLGGETYSDIPAQLVPRFLWPDKPTAHASTSILGIYYGLQTIEDTRTTTISFGQVAEAYANFGLLGCAGLGALFGFVTRKIMALTRDSPLLSIPGIFLILYTTWLIDTGQTLSVWTGSLFQALIGLGTMALVLRKFVHG